MLRLVIKLRIAAGALSLVLSLPLATALAQQPTAPARPVRYRVSAWPDGVVTVTGGVGAAIPSLLGNRLPLATCSPCDPSSLPGIDRGAVGLVDARLDQASSAMLWVTVGGSALLVATARRGESDATRAVLEDAVVMAQTAAVDGLLTQWLKAAVHRARPDRYTAQGAQFTGVVEDSRSFPSGHASFAFAAAAAAASILHRRGALHRHKIETVLLFAAAAATSVLRVSAHRHFPTDVLAGAALGSAVGWVVPQLHPLR